MGGAVLFAHVFYQVKVLASSFLLFLGHLPIYYYLICSVCPFRLQDWVVVDLSLKSINCGWELMDGNGHLNVTSLSASQVGCRLLLGHTERRDVSEMS